MGRKIKAPNTQIDASTTINGDFWVKGGKPCTIKKYCALGEGVKIITSNHGVSIANLHAGLQKKITGSTGHRSKGGVVVGNNCWIGDNVIILPGVHIGNGSVVAAGSVVTKSVPAYSIVAGNPSKVIRERFSQELSDALDSISWWDWSEQEMVEKRAFFEADFEEFDISSAVKFVLSFK
nr:CatB-related O-acetyltransferase [Halomonas elongata]